MVRGWWKIQGPDRKLLNISPTIWKKIMLKLFFNLVPWWGKDVQPLVWSSGFLSTKKVFLLDVSCKCFHFFQFSPQFMMIFAQFSYVFQMIHPAHVDGGGAPRVARLLLWQSLAPLPPVTTYCSDAGGLRVADSQVTFRSSNLAMWNPEITWKLMINKWIIRNPVIMKCGLINEMWNVDKYNLW